MLEYKDVPKINSERWLSLEDFPEEEWKDVEEAKGSFMISNYGRIKALKRKRANHYGGKIWPERIRRLGYNKKGYPMVSLTVDCKSVFVGAIHRLVAKAFIPNPNNKIEVDHINAIRTDNRACNLRWVTSYENAHNSITEKRVKEARSKQVGSHCSEATKKKISESKKGDKNSMFGKRGKNHPRSVIVIQMTLQGKYVREWECAREAGKIYGFHIIDCCRGNRKQCGGYLWRYKDNKIKKL